MDIIIDLLRNSFLPDVVKFKPRFGHQPEKFDYITCFEQFISSCITTGARHYNNEVDI